MSAISPISFLQDAGPAQIASRNEPLAPLTRYRLGGPAEWLVRPLDLHQLSTVVTRSRDEDLRVRMLGGGANLLVDDDGVDGVVVRLDAPKFMDIDWGDADTRSVGVDRPVIVRVGAGVDMAKLTLLAVRRGLSGIECMAGIPGSVGGIIRMNAGGRWGEIGDVVETVSVLDRFGEIRTLSREEVGFAYRRTALGDRVVCEATLRLIPDNRLKVMQKYKDIWAEKHAHQPLGAHCAGCVFKNPPGDSAGRLIDQAGLKNVSVGSAFVSPEHANFIVANEGGRARDVLDLIELVRGTVRDRFSVDLDLEIEVWDRRGKFAAAH